MINKLTIIEDDLIINEQLVSLAKDLNIEFESFYSAEDFLKKSSLANSFYLIDWKLPSINGIDVIKKIRSVNPLAFIVMISATTNLDDISIALMSGADDYLIKPFCEEHLTIKLCNAKAKSERIYKVSIDKGFKFIPEGRIVSKDGKKVVLPPREFILLEKMFQNRNLTISRIDLHNFLGLEENSGNAEAVIHSLRKNIRPLSMNIKSIRKTGYKVVH